MNTQHRAKVDRAGPPLYWTGLLCCALSMVLGACNQDPETLPPRRAPGPENQGLAQIPDAELSDKQGHTRMIQVLRAIAQSADNHSPYHGRQNATRLLKIKEQLGPDATPLQRWEINIELGLALLRLGEVRPAIDHLTAANGMLGPAKIDAARANLTRFKLGVAYMRWGETQNCCKLNNPDSCIVPIQGGGIHTDREGSTSAIRLFKEVLATARSARSPALQCRRAVPRGALP